MMASEEKKVKAVAGNVMERLLKCLWLLVCLPSPQSSPWKGEEAKRGKDADYLFVGAEHGAAGISGDKHAGDFSIVFFKCFVPPAGGIP